MNPWIRLNQLCEKIKGFSELELVICDDDRFDIYEAVSVARTLFKKQEAPVNELVEVLRAVLVAVADQALALGDTNVIRGKQTNDFVVLLQIEKTQEGIVVINDAERQEFSINDVLIWFKVAYMKIKTYPKTPPICYP